MLLISFFEKKTFCTLFFMEAVVLPQAEMLLKKEKLLFLTIFLPVKFTMYRSTADCVITGG